MYTTLNIALIIAGILLLVIYYYKVFKQLMKTPMLFFLSLAIWIIIIITISFLIDKTYFNHSDIIDTPIKNKNLKIV